MSETSEKPEGNVPRTSVLRRLGRALNHTWVTTVLGGLLVIFLTPMVTGFAELTFRTKSWEVFGISNEANGPGSYLSPDAVYRVPLGERFRLDEDLLFSASWLDKVPHFTLTGPNGNSKTRQVSSSASISYDGACASVAVHLMRMPQAEEQQFFIMYTTQQDDKQECLGWWRRLFS